MRTLLVSLHSKYIHPSLALPCLATYCAESGAELHIREFTVHEPKESILAALLGEQPEVVAFSVYLWNRRETLELVDALAVARPELKIALGGPEVSFDGAELFARHPGLTALVRGEGELPLRNLLSAWRRGTVPTDLTRLTLRHAGELLVGPEGPPLADLDAIPSPFAAGLIDTSRGFVYYETSRGCPYSCAFCMSALDERVHSYGMARIETDLAWLMEREVAKVKLVDRTFNYDAARARRIWRFILSHNRRTHFHFEIGAHLLDAESLRLLEEVPDGMFQFEIGVQSVLPATLDAIGRRLSLEKLERNVRALRERTRIHLHLDLISGLPGEDKRSVLNAIDRVMALDPHHLQLEPVKLLPGSPLRRDAAQFGLRFDPHPPYTVLQTPDISFVDLQLLGGIGRLLDLTWNAGRLKRFLQVLAELFGSPARALERLAEDWHHHDRFRHPLAQRGIFEALWDFIRQEFGGEELTRLRDALAWDFAHCERVVPNNAPDFFDLALTVEEQQTARQRVRAETAALSGQGVKLQYFAASFRRLAEAPGRQAVLFLYLTRSGQGLEVRAVRLS